MTEGRILSGPRWVALLRGINVSGHNKLPMADLRHLFGELGCSDVQTYIQSGNVVFNCDTERAVELPRLVHDAVAVEFGYDIPLVLRGADELETIGRTNPFLGKGIEEKWLHVGFMPAEPEEERIALLDESRSPPDEFAVLGKEIYLNLPNGMARTKFNNAYFDSALATMVTFRNWRTTRKLLQLVKE